LAHALTTKAYGFQVHRFGVGWFWLGPMAFTDTTHMWLTSRGPRTAVNMAGIWINIVASGLLAIIAFSLHQPLITTTLLATCIIGLFNSFL
jgi:putative peptide zinc metalloprotease protein